jgi:multiple antibiotic resistance protein
MVEKFFLCFIPLFVAIDSLGVLPLFINLTSNLKRNEKRRLTTEATGAALLISILFVFAGKWVFAFLGIRESDFRIAGGLVLLIISISDVAFSGLRLRAHQGTEVGVVPIGIPLIMGPAALTTILILVDQHGISMTLLALMVNLGIVWVAFRKSDLILRVMGDAGSRAFAKIMALFLAAIAIMMIRVGLTDILGSVRP